MSLIVKESDPLPFENPKGYEFKHPCGNVVRCEEKFFVEPGKAEKLVVIIENEETCFDCTCYFIDAKTRSGKCQGLEIKTEIENKVIYDSEGNARVIRIK
jgi:hypothetical protein